MIVEGLKETLVIINANENIGEICRENLPRFLSVYCKKVVDRYGDPLSRGKVGLQESMAEFGLHFYFL